MTTMCVSKDGPVGTTGTIRKGWLWPLTFGTDFGREVKNGCLHFFTGVWKLTQEEPVAEVYVTDAYFSAVGGKLSGSTADIVVKTMNDFPYKHSFVFTDSNGVEARICLMTLNAKMFGSSTVDLIEIWVIGFDEEFKA